MSGTDKAIIKECLLDATWEIIKYFSRESSCEYYTWMHGTGVLYTENAINIIKHYFKHISS